MREPTDDEVRDWFEQLPDWGKRAALAMGAAADWFNRGSDAMPEKIKPALTPEEWAQWSWDEDGPYVDAPGVGQISSHAHAAISLHGQPFGFTHEMVDALREAYGSWRISGTDNLTRIRILRAIENIERLLPPR